jgi:hypothetical protein
MYTLHPPTSQKTRDDSLHCACRAAKQPRYLAGWGLQRSLSQGGGKVGESGLGSRHQRTSDLTTSSTKPKRPSFNQVPCDISLDLSLAQLGHLLRPLTPQYSPSSLSASSPSSAREVVRPQLTNPPCPRRLASSLGMPSRSRSNRLCSWRSRCSSQVRLGLVLSGLVWSPSFLSLIPSCWCCCLLYGGLFAEPCQTYPRATPRPVPSRFFLRAPSDARPVICARSSRH